MQKLQLSIPEPCHESWQQMTPTDQGRFCNACAKEVVDFSTMTDMQVLNYFSTLTHEKVCGRALPEQLNRTLSRPIVAKKRLFWYWNYIVMFFMFFTKGNAAKAQGDVKITTQLSPVKQKDINKALEGKVGMMLVKNDSRVITGKVTDINGNPVSFAFINVKGTPTGVSADAYGVYSIKVNPNDILVVSGARFKTTEVSVNNQSVVDIVMPVGGTTGEMDIRVTFGGMIGTNKDHVIQDKTKVEAILKVKDEETGKFLPDVSVVITKNGSSETVLTDEKGMYKIKGITAYDKCFIKVSAAGYEGSEFTISETDFKDRKKEWEVFLRKQKVVTVTSTETAKPGTEVTVRFGGMYSISQCRTRVLYVVDGIMMPNPVEIKPDDIDVYTTLTAAEAMGLYGPKGSNGAVIITTRKAKEKDLETIFISTGNLNVGVVTVDYSTTSSVIGEMVNVVTVKSTITDTLKMIATKITGALKIYPNPVQRGNTFNIALKLKQTGLYQIQITDATGKVVLQKQVNAVTKEFTENMAADSRWGSGMYYISLINDKDQLINKTGFIIQL